MCASLTGASFPGRERRAAEGARGEKRPQPISIGDADDAAHILLAVTSGGRRARPSSFKPRAGVKGSPAVVELAVHYQMKAGARSCRRRAHPLCIHHRQQGNHVRLHLRLPGRTRKSAPRRRRPRQPSSSSSSSSAPSRRRPLSSRHPQAHRPLSARSRSRQPRRRRAEVEKQVEGVEEKAMTPGSSSEARQVDPLPVLVFFYRLVRTHVHWRSSNPSPIHVVVVLYASTLMMEAPSW